jgi:AraC-like DNA-binding protein
MIFKTYIPRLPLSMFVEYLWFYSGDNTERANELNLPEGTVDLIIDLGEDKIRMHDRQNPEMRFGPAVLCGPQSDYSVMNIADVRLQMGVHFRLGRAGSFLGAPIYEALNKHFSLYELWGTAAIDLRDELLFASSISERFRILEKHLLAHINCKQDFDPAIDYVLHKYSRGPHVHSIKNAADQLGLSPKRFNRMFKDRVGMTPKRLYRLMRFQKVLHHIQLCRQMDWVEISWLYGYYDQSHFIKEFQSFSGLTPTEYSVKKSVHPSHVPV